MASRRYALQRAVEAVVARDWKTAEKLLRQRVRRHSDDSAALRLLGQVLTRTGRSSPALGFLRRAVDACPADPGPRIDLAAAMIDAGLAGEAADCLGAASALADSAESHWHIGTLWRRLGRLPEAAASFERAVVLSPEHIAARGDWANTLVELGQPAAALPHFQAVLQIDPRRADVRANLAAACEELDHPLDAALACRQALAIEPAHPTALLTLGNALTELGETGGAAAAYRAALIAQPGALRLRYNLSLAELALGNWSRGWEGFRLRHSVDPTVRVVSGIPRWNGEPIPDGTLLVRREQGIGTQLMFASYLPLLAERCGQVLVECDGRVQPLLARSLPNTQPLTGEQLFELEEDFAGGSTGRGVRRWKITSPDCEIAIADLPALLCPDPTHLPHHPSRVDSAAPGVQFYRGDERSHGYLAADPQVVTAWRKRLSDASNPLRVGISWRGGRTAAAMRKRTTSLAEWTPLLQTPGVNFVSLQHGDVEPDLAGLAAYDVLLTRFTDVDLFRDLDSLAGLIAALDLVISVDNSVVHLAGALGQTTWLLVPRATDWRWQTAGRGNPWYPSVELFRQPTLGDWPAVFSELESRLSALAAEHAHERQTAPARRVA